MKVPIIRQLYQTQSVENLEKTLELLEAFCEFRGTTPQDLDVAGELITNICGALEVHAKVEAGMSDKDAINTFAQRVMGAIDKG